MPTYDYECKECGHKFDMFQKITDGPRRRCPACGRLKARRLIGMGAGIIFKGSGFYQTDYRSEGYHKRMKEEKGDAAGKPKKDSTSAGASGSAETKAETNQSKTAAAGKD